MLVAPWRIPRIAILSYTYKPRRNVLIQTTSAQIQKCERFPLIAPWACPLPKMKFADSIKGGKKHAVDNIRDSSGVVASRISVELHDGWIHSPAARSGGDRARHQPCNWSPNGLGGGRRQFEI